MHDFYALILQQLLLVSNKDRRSLEDELHLRHGVFHRFIDEGYAQGKRMAPEKMAHVFFAVGKYYDSKIEMCVHSNTQKAEQLWREYADFRQLLREKLGEIFKKNVGVGRYLK